MPSISQLTLHSAPAAGFDEPFAMLDACHERVRRSLALLQRLQDHLRAHGADDAARRAAHDVLRYFDLAAPAHHEDEERHVLPLLRAPGAGAQNAALADRLHADHRAMAGAWAQARLGLAALAGGEAWPIANAERCLAAWQAFAALYPAHLEAEDRVAFAFAASKSNAAARRAMGLEMAARRGVVPR